MKGKKLEDFPENTKIGTSSLRRITNLKNRYPHLKCENIRGNLNTRLKKLEEGNIKFSFKKQLKYIKKFLG